MNNTNFRIILAYIFVAVIAMPFFSYAQEKSAENSGNVSVEKATNSIFSRIPKFVTGPFIAVIDWAETERADLNIYAEKEILKARSIPVKEETKSENNSTAQSLTNINLGSPLQVFAQVKFYIFWIIAFIASHQWLFWAILFLIFFALVRGVIKIIF